jgi:cytochrome c-type biogenesis protein CcsB
MNDPGLIFYILTLCFYFAAAVVFLLELTVPEKNVFSVARAMLIAGLVLLTLLILGRGLSYEYFPMFTFHETLLTLVWVATLILLVLERFYQFKTVYFITLPLLFLFLFLALFFSPESAHLLPELRGFWLSSHVITVIIAYSMFAVAFVVSLMYLLIDYYLKKKKLSLLVVRLPSLDTLDFYNYKLISVGFFLLTLSIFLGALWAQQVWESYWRWDPKEIWSVVTWIVYAAYLHSRLLSGWQGRKMALLNFLGFSTVLFNYVIIRFFFSGGLHQFF